MTPHELLTDGSPRWKDCLVLAHGAGAPMDSDFMNDVATRLTKRVEHDRGLAVLPRMSEAIDDLARSRQRQPILGQGWAGDVSAKSLDSVARPGTRSADANRSMQRDSVEVGAEFLLDGWARAWLALFHHRGAQARSRPERDQPLDCRGALRAKLVEFGTSVWIEPGLAVEVAEALQPTEDQLADVPDELHDFLVTQWSGLAEGERFITPESRVDAVENEGMQMRSSLSAESKRCTQTTAPVRPPSCPSSAGSGWSRDVESASARQHGFDFSADLSLCFAGVRAFAKRP
jgi:Alpha/beta hydrolase domain